MILEQKSTIIEKHVIKKKLVQYYVSTLFSTIFLISLSYLTLFLISSPEKYITFFGFPKKTIKIFQPIFVVMNIFGLWGLIIWLFNSISSILVNKYYKFNIFRAIKWAKIKFAFLIKTQLLKELNEEIQKNNTDELELIKTFNNNHLVLQGSKALSIKYKDFWRETNDLDFISVRNLKDYEFLNSIDNLKINYIDNIVAKLDYKGKEIEVLFPKAILSYYTEQKDGVVIPNYNWMLAMKIHQLFSFYSVDHDEKSEQKVSFQKIKNSLIDIAFLLSKKQYYNVKILAKYILDLYVSNLFIAYFTNHHILNISTNNSIKEFKKYINEKISKIDSIEEVQYLIDDLCNELMHNEKIKNIAKYVNEIITNKENIEEEFLNHSTNSKREINSLKRLFNSANEKNQYIKNKFKNLNNIDEVLVPFNKQIIENLGSDNELDIRQILLFELNEKLRGAKNE
ncbi:MAG4530 family protein [Mycoplasmopsis adleri]|uniref:MAG4530 family protein n=1 Tax=Mycoplasmopsis adleri TaxID=51362 RepID=UPI0038739DF9